MEYKVRELGWEVSYGLGSDNRITMILPASLYQSMNFLFRRKTVRFYLSIFLS